MSTAILNSRRYFRYDVVLPMHMEPVDRYGKQLSSERRYLLSREEEARLQTINSELNLVFQKVQDANPAALHIFITLNKRLDFMWWMLDFIIESEDPSVQHDYKLRMKEDAECVRPTNKKSSIIAPLILGLYDAIDDYIVDLNVVLKNSVKEGEFSYQGLSQMQFDATHYVTNLDTLAQSGVLPVQILQLMVEKINRQASVLETLKEAYRKTSSTEAWKHYQINLSPIGCSFLTNDDYPLFMNMDLYMNIEGAVIICRGKVVSQEQIEGELLDTRVSIEFDVLTQEQEQVITLFLQHNELRDSMKVVPEPYIDPY